MKSEQRSARGRPRIASKYAPPVGSMLRRTVSASVKTAVAGTRRTVNTPKRSTRHGAPRILNSGRSCLAKGGAGTSSNSTDSRSPSTTYCSRRRMGSARSATARSGSVSMENSADSVSITTTRPGAAELYSVIVATAYWAMRKTMLLSCGQRPITWTPMRPSRGARA